VLTDDLFDRFLATSDTPRPEFTVLDDQLDVLVTNRFEGDHFAVDRLTLRGILSTGLDIRFGAEVVHHEDTTARFADGSTATGDILVAADGINSAVRAQYLPHARIVDTGVRQIYGKVVLTDSTRPLFDDTMFGIFTTIRDDTGVFVGVAPVRFPIPGPTVDYMTCTFGARKEWFEEHAGEDPHAVMTNAVADWHPRARAIVAHCDPASLFLLPLRTSVPVDPWTTTRVTLLGDAIHAMSPAAGAGACTALRDAASLTEALTTEPDVDKAIQAYETDMVGYGFDAVRTGASNGERFLGQDPLPTR
jgi:2-polyprenyl-6-methoxyphenol hydroxylase-like FAD-dependent oxidoreductase